MERHYNDAMNPMYTREFHDGITETFHYTNTIRAASSALAADVARLISAGANDAVLEAFYGVPGGHGQNLRVFAKMSAEDQEAAAAENWLFSVVGRYEVWADSLPVAKSSRGAQFPSSGSSSHATGVGFAEVFPVLTASPEMISTYYASVQADHRVLAGDRVDDALSLYRLFKECRNAAAHAGGVTDGPVSNWSTLARERAGDLFVDASGDVVPIPELDPGDQIRLSLRQVRAFVALTMRIAYTIDSIVTMSAVGLTTVVERWRRVHGERPLFVSERVLRRGQWLRARLTAASIAVPDDPADALALLRGEDLLRLVI
ncbi:hypothetical protein [Actinomycetospora soli]|uniref:hypothetical protein n=1 Tax=Actinomycetospora soli TaxID=2893887 RepID=UPI001E295BDD|nr:hypothetical protein [Actinomycetospora soli]MCD2191564.1 hypothetical protein [Actinomycetospora soli]